MPKRSKRTEEKQETPKKVLSYQYKGPLGKRIHLPASGLTFNPQELDTDKKIETFLKRHPGLQRLFQKEEE